MGFALGIRTPLVCVLAIVGSGTLTSCSDTTSVQKPDAEPIGVKPSDVITSLPAYSFESVPNGRFLFPTARIHITQTSQLAGPKRRTSQNALWYELLRRGS